MMEPLFNRLLETFSLEYMFTIIMASYFIIKVIDQFNGNNAVPTWLKRVITASVGLVAWVVFSRYTDTSFECLAASYFAAVFVYDTAIKVLLKKFDIDYKK